MREGVSALRLCCRRTGILICVMIAGFREKHPYLFATACGVGATAGTFALAPVVGLAALGAVGFTSGGVVAGNFSCINIVVVCH